MLQAKIVDIITPTKDAHEKSLNNILSQLPGSIRFVTQSILGTSRLEDAEYVKIRYTFFFER